MLLIWLIIILAFVVRLVTLGQSLWLDEAIGALAAKNMNYAQILSDLMAHDNHPPLYYLLLKFWTSIFGYSEVALRMPSLIFGVATVYLTCAIANEIAPKKKFFSLFVGLFIALSQFHIYYSQEARMYSMAGFFAALAIYAFLKTLKKQTPTHYWTIFAIAITLMMFSDYMPVFLLPVFPLVGYLVKKDKKWWTRLVASFAPLLILGLLWLPHLKIQAESGSWLVSAWPAWSKVAGGATIKQLALVWIKFVSGRISLSSKLLYYGLVIISSITICLSLFIAHTKRKKEMNIVWLWLIVPIALGFLASFFFPAFIYFRFTYVIPAFYLLIAWGVLEVKKDKHLFSLLGILLVSSLISFFIYTHDETQQREHWRDAVSFVEEKRQEGDIVLFEFPEPVAPYNWYSTGKIESKGATDSINADSEKTKRRTEELVQDKNGVYYFEYLYELSDPGKTVTNTLSELGFNVRDTHDFPGVGIVYYYTK